MISLRTVDPAGLRRNATSGEDRVVSKKLIVLALMAALVTAYFYFDLGQYLDFEYLKAQREVLQSYYAAHPWGVIGLYFLLYVLVTAVSLPGATVMTLAGGALFGLWKGFIIISFASTIGATLAFLVARFVLRDWVQTRFGDRLDAINRGIEKEGAFYLFTLRLVPIFPFFIINLVMGLTPMRTSTFYWVSQLGMVAGTLVYVNAGTQLASLESPAGILSPGLIGSFALLGVFPLLARRFVRFLKRRKALAKWTRPTSFDRNLIVIGAGSGGLVSAYIAAAVKARVSLIEKHRMGGDCLNTGCVPSKALIRSSRFVAEARRAEAYGVAPLDPKVDFSKVMARVQGVVDTVAPHDSVERYTKLGVDCIRGEARVLSPWSVEVNGRTLTTRAIVIATGAHPFVPPIEGIETVDYLTSDTFWLLREIPPRLLVLGGGPIGCEIAQAMARLGSRVTLVQRRNRLQPREDAEVSATVLDAFTREGVDVRLNHQTIRFYNKGGEQRLVCEHQGAEVEIPFDRVLVAVGRRANTKGLGLEEVGVGFNRNGTVRTDECLQTDCPTIYACGDVVGPYQFTHSAAHQAWYATVNALFGGIRRYAVDNSVIPHVTFTDPEVAGVGLNESLATAQGTPYEVTRYDLSDLDRAIAEGEATGFVKVLTVPGKDRILGATIVGLHAGELITEFVSAMRNGYGLNRILSTIHAYPTLAEANKYVAGNWKRAHAPQRALRWLARFHRWRLRHYY